MILLAVVSSAKSVLMRHSSDRFSATFVAPIRIKYCEFHVVFIIIIFIVNCWFQDKEGEPTCKSCPAGTYTECQVIAIFLFCFVLFSGFRLTNKLKIIDIWQSGLCFAVHVARTFRWWKIIIIIKFAELIIDFCLYRSDMCDASLYSL